MKKLESIIVKKLSIKKNILNKSLRRLGERRLVKKSANDRTCGIYVIAIETVIGGLLGFDWMCSLIEAVKKHLSYLHIYDLNVLYLVYILI